MVIKDIKIGFYGDVQITSRTVGESTDYVTADSGMPIQVFRELIDTWIKYSKTMKLLDDEIFREAEFLWKEYEPANSSIKLKILKEVKDYMSDPDEPASEEMAAADLDDMAYTRMKEDEHNDTGDA